jgi:tetratricopeptide (TPR) repeat protein
MESEAAAHPDEETLVLFAEGALPGAERPGVIGHLADCSACRRVVAHLVSWSDEAVPAPAVEPSRKASRRRWWTYCIALTAAASVLCVVGVRWWPTGPFALTEETAYAAACRYLEGGQFDRADEVIQRAAARGITSDRLCSLDAQAARKMPGPLALACAGRLSDFGYDIGGVVARDPAHLPHRVGLREAELRLAQAGIQDLEAVLNRGHLQLTLNRPQEAAAEFERAATLAPEHPLVWLGLGLAAFLNDDFVGAERAFRRVLDKQPRHVAARINLAMTLEELDKKRESLAVWQGLLQDELSAADRTKIEARIAELGKDTP